jgi:pimeloyl-ACP methyl ester carboxylesterase
VGGARVPVYTWGEGQWPVLLVHGWRGRAAELTEIVRELRSSDRTVIAFDAPAHGAAGRGKSDIRVFASIIRRLHEQFGDFEAIVAHSFGSPASTLAIREGVRAGRLVSIGGVAEMGYLAEHFGRALGLRPRTIDGLRRRVETRRFRGVPDVWTSLSSTGVPLAADVPLLIVHDSDDPVVEVAQAHALAAAHPQSSTLLVTSGLGHTRILRDNTVLDAIGEFVNASPVPARTR